MTQAVPLFVYLFLLCNIYCPSTLRIYSNMASLARVPRSLHLSPRVPFLTQTHLHVRNPAFSTSVYLDKQSAPNTTQKADQTGNPELPRLTLENLGISKNVRIVLYTLLGLWGTAETYFYYQAVMRWWKSGRKADGETD